MQQACLNDFNAEALVRYGAFEAAMRLVLSHQPSQGAQAVTEALTLLYTASTTPVVRESIAASAASLRAVGALVAHADRAPSLRARTAALAVLSQCMGSAALRKALVGGQAGAEAAEVVRSLSAAAGGPSAPGAEQACSALGNMFGDESLRGVGAAEGAASALLLTTRKHSGTAASGVRRAALGALANLLLDGTAAGSVTER